MKLGSVTALSVALVGSAFLSTALAQETATAPPAETSHCIQWIESTVPARMNLDAHAFVQVLHQRNWLTGAQFGSVATQRGSLLAQVLGTVPRLVNSERTKHGRRDST